MRNVRKRIFDGRETAPCFWCQDPLTFDDSTIDHVIGRAEGGKVHHKGETNVVLSCAECNKLRAILQNLFRTKRRSKKVLKKWPSTSQVTLNQQLKHLPASIKRKRPAIEAAEKAFQERCKIKLRRGKYGMIYPVDPVPELPETKETDESPEKKELDEQFSQCKNKAVQWS